MTLAIKNGWLLDTAALNQAAAYHAELHGDAAPETRKTSR